MLRNELYYELPPELIAQQPASPRDASRLMVVDRRSGRIQHRVFCDLGELLAPHDCLVVNDSRVIPARFFARRSSGGRVEGLFLHEADGLWTSLLKPSDRLKVGETLTLVTRSAADSPAGQITITERLERGQWRVRLDPPGSALSVLQAIGEPPLPPYIRRSGGAAPDDRDRYQTVYAATDGSIAAPTAGLHFTPRLLEELAARGIQRTAVTLHVGVGTFATIDVEDLAAHPMHREWFEIGGAAVATIASARQSGGRIVAVGTTAARVLESQSDGPLDARRAATQLFIYPPYSFRHVDVLLTNFHLPESTLLALVMAFAGVELTRHSYAAAVAERYRFFSYGDAMLIL